MKKPFLFILIIFFIYIIIILPFLYLPPLGRHAWNEAIYITFLNSIIKDNNIFFFYQAYDVQRPDFNVGYIYFWINYIFIKLINIFIHLNEVLYFRIFSIISTFLTLIVLFFILKEFSINQNVIFIILLFFLFSPLIIYYGWKVQLEPFLILLFSISQLFLIKFISNEGKFYLFNFYISCIIFGSLIATRSNFIIFIPLYFIPFLNFEKNKNIILKNIKGVLLTFSFIIFGLLITILPSFILYKQYNPFIFLYKRIFEAGVYAFSSGKEIKYPMLTFINDALWKQIILLLPLSIISLFIFEKVLSSSKQRFFFLILSSLTWLFFSLTYVHDANHTYQIYYGIIWFILSSSISLNFIYKKIEKKFLNLFIFLIIIINIFFSYNVLIYFYGFYTEKIFNKIDAYGTYESYIVGNTLRYILNETNNPEGYLLVQSPVVYYPTYHSSFTYHNFYKWNEKTKSYSEFSFFKNSSQFVEELKQRNIILLTVTPDVFIKNSKDFNEFKNINFVDICYTKNFVISINKTIFEKNPNIKAKCGRFLLDIMNKDKIAFKTINNDWIKSINISFDIWKDIDELKYFNHTYEKFSIPEINYLKNNFTVVVFLYTNWFENSTDIISKNNIWKVRFGNSQDIYFETPKTSQGYGWISGAYYIPYLSLPTCIVFKYYYNNSNIFINGIKKSENFFLIKNGTRILSEPPDLLTSEDFLIIGSQKFEGKIKIKILNKTFDDMNIYKLCKIKTDEEMFRYLIFEN